MLKNYGSQWMENPENMEDVVNSCILKSARFCSPFLQHVTFRYREASLGHTDSPMQVSFYASEHAFQRVDCSKSLLQWSEWPQENCNGEH